MLGLLFRTRWIERKMWLFALCSLAASVNTKSVVAFTQYRCYIVFKSTRVISNGIGYSVYRFAVEQFTCLQSVLLILWFVGVHSPVIWYLCYVYIEKRHLHAVKKKISKKVFYRRQTRRVKTNCQDMYLFNLIKLSSTMKTQTHIQMGVVFYLVGVECKRMLQNFVSY